MISFLFVDTERVWRGGQDQLFTLLRGLIQRNHEVSLVCEPRTLLEARARESGVEVFPLAARKGLEIYSFFRLLSIFRKARPEVLAFNTPRLILPGNLASRGAGVRLRVMFRRVNFPLRRNPITILKYNWGIDCIIAISESIRNSLQSCGVPASKIRTVYEGMDPSLFTPRDYGTLADPGKPVVAGTVAHLSAEKGLYYLVEAAALIPRVEAMLRFVIVGEGNCRQALETQVREHKLQGCFHFAGFQDRPAQYLSSFDMFVLPSLSEGLSSAILSAMATALPVVATDVGGIPELVRNGDNGLLVPAADPAALAQAIRYLVENPAEARIMGRRGRIRMEKEFTLERKIRETEALCYSLMGRSSQVSGGCHE